MGQAEQQALIKAQQAGDHRVAQPAPPPQAPTPFHHELQQQARPPAPAAVQQERPHPVAQVAAPVARQAMPVHDPRMDRPAAAAVPAAPPHPFHDPRLDQRPLAAPAAPAASAIPRHDQHLDRPPVAATVPVYNPQLDSRTQPHPAQGDNRQQLRNQGAVDARQQDEITRLQQQQLKLQQEQNQLRQQNGVAGQIPGGHFQQGQPAQPFAPQRIVPQPDGPRHGDYGWRNDDPNRDPHRFRFLPPVLFGPPQGDQWGWQDRERYQRGYDSSFFQQDPNYENWHPTINQESQNVAEMLDAGQTRAAANALNNDLWAMRGDLYGQNELLQEVAKAQSPSGEGAQLYLGDWDPTRGTWDTIEVVSPPVPDGYVPDKSLILQTFDR